MAGDAKRFCEIVRAKVGKLPSLEECLKIYCDIGEGKASALSYGIGLKELKNILLVGGRAAFERGIDFGADDPGGIAEREFREEARCRLIGGPGPRGTDTHIKR